MHFKLKPLLLSRKKFLSIVLLTFLYIFFQVFSSFLFFSFYYYYHYIISKIFQYSLSDYINAFTFNTFIFFFNTFVFIERKKEKNVFR